MRQPAIWMLTLATAAALAQAQPFPAPVDWPEPGPAPAVLPGQDYQPVLSDGAPTAEAPVVYSFTSDVGPDDSFFLCGANLGSEGAEAAFWGPSGAQESGRSDRAQVRLATERHLVATIPEGAIDGLYLLWPGRGGQWGRPVRLNAPEPWWVTPDDPVVGAEARIFGRDLARRPGREAAFVYLTGGGRGWWLRVTDASAHVLTVQIPPDVAPGPYQLWVHAGMGGRHGWGGPVGITVRPRPQPAERVVDARQFGTVGDGVHDDREALQNALAEAARDGATVRLPAGQFLLGGGLRIPSNARLVGEGKGRTVLQLASRLDVGAFPRLTASGFGQAVGRIHNQGDWMEYALDVPATGDYAVWMRYAADNAAWAVETMADRTTLTLDGQEPLKLQNMPNTGGWGAFEWSKVAAVRLEAGQRRIRWQNVAGGGLNLDAFVFTSDPDLTPQDTTVPQPGAGRHAVVVQAEDFDRAQGREMAVPGAGRAMVVIDGENVHLADLTLLGSPTVNVGLAIVGRRADQQAHHVELERVTVRDVAGKEGENAGLLVQNAHHVRVRDCVTMGQVPLLLLGARQGEFVRNRLIARRAGGNGALGAMLSRTSGLRQCVLEGNEIISSPGGGPEVMRLAWLSTGEGGSVAENYVAHNRGARFGGVAGLDQNVGETILFETNLRIPYYGPATGADARSVTLPQDGPDWDALTDGAAPPLGEYYVVVLAGPAQGEVRALAGRDGRTLTVDRPWHVPPTAESTVVVSQLFYRNLVIGNDMRDGMTGIQFWINGCENVCWGNRIANQRREGILLFGNATSLDSNQTPGWNRGIGAIYYNHVEGNVIEDVAYGIRVNTGDSRTANGPLEWPCALGNVVRHNTVVRARQVGIGVDNRGGVGDIEQVPGYSLAGSLIEYNVVRDTPTAYLVNKRAEATLFRRNHGYFWTPPPGEGAIGLRIEQGAANVVQDANVYEDEVGGTDPQFPYVVQE